MFRTNDGNKICLVIYLIIYYRLRSRGDNTVGSVRVCACVCPSVCLWALSCLNRLTFDLDFWHKGRP